MKRFQKITVGIIVSILFSWLAFRDIDFRTLGELIRNLRIVPLLWSIFFFLLMMLLRAYRFRLLLGQEKPVFRTVFDICNVGALATFILPFRLGEFSRPFMFRALNGFSFASTFAAVVVERIFDGLLHMSFLVTVLLVFNVPPAVKYCGMAAGFFYASVIVSLILLHHSTEKVAGLFRVLFFFMPGFYERFVVFIKRFSDGAGRVNTKRGLVNIFVVSVFIWVLSLYSNIFGYRALGMNLGFYEVMLLTVFVVFGMMIPAGPGYIGTYHYSMVVGMTFLGISREVSIGTAIIIHFFNTVFLFLLGLWSMWQLGFRMDAVICDSSSNDSESL